MNKFPKILGLASAAAFVFSLSAHATTYSGNGDYGFNGTAGDGPVGNGMLTFNSSGGTLTGTIAPGPNNGAGNNGQLYDELVIYISTNGTTGITSTSTLTDTTTTNATLAEAVSGYNPALTAGNTRATINFAPGFAANYAIAISPTNAQAGELFSLSSTSTNLTAVQSVSLTPVGGAGNPNYTFTLALSNIGTPASFNFSTTYLNAHSAIYRSGEAFNSITDTSTTPSTIATGSYNPGNDNVTLGVDAFTVPAAVVPEPGTWAMLLGSVGMLIGFQRRLCRKA